MALHALRASMPYVLPARFLPRRGSSTWPPMRSYPFARGPLRRPDVIAPPMEADRAPLRQFAFDFHIVGRDGLLTRHADAAGSGAVPGHAAVLFREIAREYHLAGFEP